MLSLLHDMWLVVTHMAASPVVWVPILSFTLIAIAIAIGPRRPR